MANEIKILARMRATLHVGEVRFWPVTREMRRAMARNWHPGGESTWTVLIMAG
jgi:hypothetical protein